MRRLKLILLFSVAINFNAYAQVLLPGYIHVFLIKGRAGDSVSLPGELARLDSLQLKAMDSLHRIKPWFTYEVADSAQQAPVTVPSLDLCYKVTNSENAIVRDIAMGLPTYAFLYTIQRETLNANTHKSLGSSAVMMKDLEGYLQPGPMLDIMYKDIYKRLAGEIATYVIDTKEVLSPKKTLKAGVIIDYRGITSPAPLSAHDKYIINGILNNIFVAGQQNYAFNFIPSWQDDRHLQVNKDSLIILSLSVADAGGLITVGLNFSAEYPLVYHIPVDRNPAKMSGEVLRTFTISEKDLESGGYGSLIFPICKSMNKFFLLNIPPGK